MEQHRTAEVLRKPEVKHVVQPVATSAGAAQSEAIPGLASDLKTSAILLAVLMGVIVALALIPGTEEALETFGEKLLTSLVHS